ncbi:MAG TPA: GAF domain-containing sensor histidine kinase [Candidatus Bathyarchaeia archaeon]|nr:GAF domain-containing sensor histidine kinase [Candidatus Bathyarchaeia archaeon]
MIALPLLLLAAIALALAVGHQGADSVLRHLYLVPTLWAGLTRGAFGGGLIGGLAGLLHAPTALPAVERAGLTSQTLDGLLSIVLPAAAGLLVGRLVDAARGREARLAAVLAMQRCLHAAGPLQERLTDVAEELRVALSARRLALMVGADVHTALLASVPTGTLVDPASAAGWTLRTGQSVTSRDLAVDPRVAAVEPQDPTPLRGLTVPLRSGAGMVGVMAVEWAGELSRATRAAAEELALHTGLVVENARLTMRQLRFGEELEEKITAATARLVELDRAKTEFLSVVSHELRTPLTALQGFSELLLRSAVPPEKVHRCLVYIHTEACALGRIVGELLDLSRIEAGRPLEMKPERIDLDLLMERNVDLFAAEHRQHRFRWTPSPPGVELRADPDALDRMLKNLLSNAVKYSPRGGEVVVSASPALDQPGMVEVAVEDDGVGIPAEQLSRIFDKYVRVAHPETTAARGLGLGLSLVRALAEAHGGRVEVDSLPGKGSRFRLLLPGR